MASEIRSYRAGAAAFDITPAGSMFLFGYPHVSRYSTGVHDPLLSSALCLDDGRQAAMFVANDIIFVPRASALRVRQKLTDLTGVPPENIMLSATHTHSGPLTVDYISNRNDPVVPPVDADYLAQMENGMIRAGLVAWESRQPAELLFSTADGSAVGGNRRDPGGPANPRVPVMLVRERKTGQALACMLVCSMHPTVLHEDSKLVSADFPGMTRSVLQREWLGDGVPVLHHTGPAGNQSPRHVTRANTFAEAERLGALLAQAVIGAFRKDSGSAPPPAVAGIACRRVFCDLPPRDFPSVSDAETRRREVAARFEELRRERAPRQLVRTAECDLFGAEETLALAQAAEAGELARARAGCLPAEVQAIAVGDRVWVGWPGECFVEYALEVRQTHPEADVVSLANGELQGYIVTPEAAAEGGYEASNALFSCESGALLVETTRRLLDQLRRTPIAGTDRS